VSQYSVYVNGLNNRGHYWFAVWTVSVHSFMACLSSLLSVG